MCEGCNCKPKTPSLPKWCEAGQWVTVVDCTPLKGLYGVIVEVDELNLEYSVRFVGINKPLTFKCASNPMVKPIRFRVYTYEEAKGLLGKAMESCHYGDREAELITKVSYNSDGGLMINGSSFYWYSKNVEATIDGLPIGVPEVDADAIWEGEQ